jgi:hypothetical protein
MIRWIVVIAAIAVICVYMLRREDPRLDRGVWHVPDKYLE